jgi:hypothetical protein
MSDAARFLRQVLLPEIGQAGQARIQAAAAAVGGGSSLSHEVAELYARAAGFREISPGSIDVDVLAPLAEVRSPAAREVLAGARAALAAVRAAALDVGAQQSAEEARTS